MDKITKFLDNPVVKKAHDIFLKTAPQLLDGTIEANIYKNKKNELFENKVKLQDQIVKLQTQGSSWLGPMREFINIAVTGDKTARAKNNPDELCSIGKNIGSDYFLTPATGRQVQNGLCRAGFARGLPF